MMSSGMESITFPISEKPAVLHSWWRITSTAIYEHYSAAALFSVIFHMARQPKWP